MSSYRQALKATRTEHIHKLIDNNQNNPRFLFSTEARLTNEQMSPKLIIPSQFNSNDFMNLFTDKIDNIRNTQKKLILQRLVLQLHSSHPKKTTVLYTYRTG